MPKDVINGSPLDSLALKKVLGPKQIVSLNHSVPSSDSVKRQKTDLLIGDNISSLIQKSEGLHVFESADGLDDIEGTPIILRKDRLVQEIENSLAEIEDHYSNTSKLEEEKSAVEMERNSLLKDIEEAIAEIQNHVLTSSELKLERGSLQEECIGLRDQVDHLKMVLDSPVDIENGDKTDGQNSDVEKQILALKAEINVLTLENEKIKSKVKNDEDGDIPSDMMSRELELLHDENANLQKLLQMAEESEENMVKEMKSYQSKITEIQKLNESLKKENKKLKTEKQQLELDRDELEEELDHLQTGVKKNGDQNGSNLMLKVRRILIGTCTVDSFGIRYPLLMS